MTGVGAKMLQESRSMKLSEIGSPREARGKLQSEVSLLAEAYKAQAGSRKPACPPKPARRRREVRNPELRPRHLDSCLLLLASIVLFGSVPSLAQEKAITCSSSTSLELREKILGGPVSISADAPVVKRKSPALAGFASLAVPGLGELYAGRYDVGKYSTIAEVSLWAFYTAVELYSDQVRNDAISFAAIHAGTQVVGKPSQFFVDIGNFMNTSDYQSLHIENGDYGGAMKYQSSTYQWQWQSNEDRAKFKDLRIKADNYLNIGRYALAVIFLNHILSAVDAARLTSAFNASATTSLDNTPGTEGMYLKVEAGF